MNHENMIFEKGKEGNAYIVNRIKVWKGWIISEQIITDKGEITNSICFVPDEDHEWKLEK